MEKIYIILSAFKLFMDLIRQIQQSIDSLETLEDKKVGELGPWSSVRDTLEKKRKRIKIRKLD